MAKMKKDNIKNRLRIGRVYHINPDPIPPFKLKEREAVYVGIKNVKGKKMYVFIQMGSSKYIDNDLKEFNEKTKYFWMNMKRPGYFHLATSKPEYFRTIKNEYRTKQKYVEMKKSHACELFKIWEQKIKSLENTRWKRASGFFNIGQNGESLKQMYLLKYTMPWKYKTLKPTKKLEHWKEKDKANTNN